MDNIENKAASNIISRPGGAEPGGGSLNRSAREGSVLPYGSPWKKFELPTGQTPPPPPAPPVPVDPFLAKYAARFYAVRDVPQFTPGFVQFIAETASIQAITPEEKQFLDDVSSKCDALWRELSLVTQGAVQRKFVVLVEENERAVQAGDPGAIVELPDRVKLDTDFAAQRKAIRDMLRANSATLQPIISAICQRLEQAARVVVEKHDEGERSEAEKWGVPYAPSDKLKLCVAFALSGAMRPAKSFVATSGMSPVASLWGLYEPPATPAIEWPSGRFGKPDLFKKDPPKVRPFTGIRRYFTH